MDPIPQITPIPQAVRSSNSYDGARIPVLRVDGATVTRQLPPSFSNTGSNGGRPTQQSFPSLSRPTIDVPTVGFEYPELNVPTQEEFDAAAGAAPSTGNGKTNDSGSDDNPARALTNNLPTPTIPTQQPPAVIQATSETSAGLTATDPQQAATPTTPQPQQTSASTNGSVTLPFIGTVPLPSRESVALASTTAVTATFVAVMGKAAIEASMEGLKPMLRLLAIRYKKMRSKRLTDEEIQLEFSFVKKKKGKRTLSEMLQDVKQYLSENFFDDLIG